MSKRIVSLIILAEDERSSNFLRRYLNNIRAIDPRAIRQLICTGGSGKQHVTERYPTEVKEQRRCVSGRIKNAALLVHLDADTGTVAGEKTRLDAALTRSGQGPRASHERIALAIPKRHTETWIHGLCGVEVTEDDDCKRNAALRRSHDANIRPAADKLYELTRAHAPDPPTYLPSVAAAVPELQRLES